MRATIFLPLAFLQQPCGRQASRHFTMQWPAAQLTLTPDSVPNCVAGFLNSFLPGKLVDEFNAIKLIVLGATKQVALPAIEFATTSVNPPIHEYCQDCRPTSHFHWGLAQLGKPETSATGTLGEMASSLQGQSRGNSISQNTHNPLCSTPITIRAHSRRHSLIFSLIM